MTWPGICLWCVEEAPPVIDDLEVVPLHPALAAVAEFENLRTWDGCDQW